MTELSSTIAREDCGILKVFRGAQNYLNVAVAVLF
jgi:hypothetical protein